MTTTGTAVPDAALAEIISFKSVEAPPDLWLQRAGSLARRLQVALYDLGVDVPNGWAVPTSDGLAFEDLTFKQADALVRRLEDIAAVHTPSTPGPGPGQRTLF